MYLMHGSSPLTRGKQRPQLRRRLRQRLIPAHAGKTGHDTPGSSRSSAHPRSRGENPSTLNNGENVNGSSPLTRGKPSPSITSQAGSAAHPRSRGENKDTRSGLWESMGSSPLTRGKPLVFGDLLGNERLIPAHAGKTTWTTPCSRPTAAHPRSRGENYMDDTLFASDSGSSPLTRGKPQTAPTVGPRGRLIPAHAGKTSRASRVRCQAPAHPRSRGENLRQ